MIVLVESPAASAVAGQVTGAAPPLPPVALPAEPEAPPVLLPPLGAPALVVPPAIPELPAVEAAPPADEPALDVAPALAPPLEGEPAALEGAPAALAGAPAFPVPGAPADPPPLVESLLHAAIANGKAKAASQRGAELLTPRAEALTDTPGRLT